MRKKNEKKKKIEGLKQKNKKICDVLFCSIALKKAGHNKQEIDRNTSVPANCYCNDIPSRKH